MKNSLKKFYATLLMVILIMVFSAPFTAFAESGTLGTESPVLSAVFKDGDDVVDGNELVAGNYTVDIILSGMKAVSVFQITANVSNMTINEVSTIADSDNSFSCGAIVNENNSFVAILASENDSTSAIENGTAMATLDVTVESGDFADMFAVSTDPDLTFVEADYGDGYDDAYVCTVNTDKQYAQMTFDMSPELTASTFSVTGQVMIADDETGAESAFGIGGITVSIDDTTISAVTDENGYYTLTGLAEGEYTMSIVGETTIDRKVTLIVTPEKADEKGEITLNKVGIVICDYNKDKEVNATDIAEFSDIYSGNYSIYADFNADKEVNATDIALFSSFIGANVNYENVTL